MYRCSKNVLFSALLLSFWTTAATGNPEAPWIVGRTKPRWAESKPVRILRVKHDARKTDEVNGFELNKAVQALQPGDRLEIGPGRYSMKAKFNLNLSGTASKPIWIVGTDPTRMPVITRPDSRQNVVNMGERSRTEHVVLRHLELTGGSTLIRLYDCHHIWLDQCHLHHAGHEGITTNTRDTSHLFITRNHFHDFKNPKATGEAMYLGANHGKAIMSDSVIADNHVHDCGGTQGDGIEVKQGSHHNWIYRNEVHDTNYPCILVYGTAGNGMNMVERNTCYRSNDNVMQVQGEAIVRNNLLMTAKGSGLSSTDHQGRTTRLVILHNTIISRRRGVNLSSWSNRTGLVFANNVVFTDDGDALRFPSGSRGVTIAGNVVCGRVSGASAGFVNGRGLDDFHDVSWDGAHRDAWFRQDSPFLGQGFAGYSVKFDIGGRHRSIPPTAGAFIAH